MNFPILHQLGLTENEALIYGLLLENGSMKASDIENLAKIGRGNVYNVLTNLYKEGLVLPIEGKQTRYQPVNPAELRKILEKRLTETKSLETLFQTQLPTLTSAFNLSTGKPAIQVFEGVEGFRKALEDVLASKTEILTHIDIEAVKGPLAELDAWYDRNRAKRGIANRILVADTPKNREAFKQLGEQTDIKFIKNFPQNFQTAMEIYDGTVTYFTLRETKEIAVVIKDPAIYEMHRAQFDYLWVGVSSTT